MTEGVAAADALVAAVEPALRPPTVRHGDVVLVTGPWMAGTSSVLAALRDRLPEHVLVEELDVGQAPAAVVFVVSAASPLTESDCALVDLTATDTDLVIGVVSKIDAYRNWREVLAADRALLAAHAPRYAHVPWVGTAGAPDLGEPRVDELVGVLRRRLAEPELYWRNRLRAWESHLNTSIARYSADGEGADRAARVATLHANRDDVVRGWRTAKSERTIALRSRSQQARVQLGYYARTRCSSVRAELAEDVAELGRAGLREFEAQARDRIAEVVAEVDDGITVHLADTAERLGLPAAPAPPPAVPPEPPSPPLTSRRLETQLMTILGAGFGLGVALVVTRLFAGLAPGFTVGGLVVGGLVGLVLTLWVVGIRGVLRDRAVLDRWVTDVATELRSAVEERVATRVLAAEHAWASAAAAVDERESGTAERRLAEIDAELREHAAQTARAVVLRDQRVPALQRALNAVRTELRRFEGVDRPENGKENGFAAPSKSSVGG